MRECSWRRGEQWEERWYWWSSSFSVSLQRRNLIIFCWCLMNTWILHDVEVMSDRNSYVEAESRNEVRSFACVICFLYTFIFVFGTEFIIFWQDHQIEENRRRCGGYGNKGKVPWNKRRKHSEGIFLADMRDTCLILNVIRH